MNYMEQHIFEQHMKEIDTKYEDFAKEIMSLQDVNTFTVIYGTDIHYIRKYALYVPSYYKLKEMVEFSGCIGADLMAIGGDTADGNTTLRRQYRDLYDTVSLIRKAKTTSVVISKGNHDDASWYAFKNELGTSGLITPEQWYTHVINPIRVLFPITLDKMNPTGGYYYIDYPFHKIRVVNLNTNDVPIILDDNGNLVKKELVGQWMLGMQDAQLNWLAKDALYFPEKGWSVLFMSHSSSVSDKLVHNREVFNEIITAFKNNSAGIAASEDEYFNSKVEYDFSENQSNDVLFYMCGHNHKDTLRIENDITVVTTKNILGDLKQPPFDEPDSVSYSSWDCMLIDKNKRKLITKRFGIPDLDREIDF